MHTDAVDAAEPIFETASLGMIVVSLDAEVLQANEAAAELIGIELGDLIGANALELLDGDDRALGEDRLAAIRGGSTQAAADVYRYVTPAGDERWLASDTAVLQGPDGTADHSVVFIQDATARVHLERALEHSTTSLSHLVDSAPVAILSVTPDGRVLTWNAAAETMFGWSADELVGGPLPILPEDVDAGLGLRLQRLLDGQELAGLELPARHRDGHTVDTITSAVARRLPDGTVEDVIAFSIDVTAQRASERRAKANDRRFRKMVDNLREVVAIINPQGAVLASSVLGATAGTDDLSSGRVAVDQLLPMLHPDDQPRGLEFFSSVVQLRGEERHEVFRVADPVRQWAWLQVTAVNHIDDPDIAGVVITIADITRHKRDEALLADQSSVLELIARSAPLDEVLDAIVAMVGDHLVGATSALLLLEDDRITVAAGDLPDDLVDALEAPDAAERFGVLREVMRTGEPIVVPDLANDPLCAASKALMTGCGLAAGWAVPITGSDGTSMLGAFAAWFEQSRSPGRHETRVAEVAAHLADIAIERSRAEADLVRVARFDPLTGLPNRVSLLEHLAGALERTRPRGTSVAVMYLDLDRFKLVNDNLGHTMGDRLMVAFGQRLQALVRPGDVVGRFEGDEFVVVLEDVIDERDTRPVISRLQLALSEPFTIDDNDVVLTASIGVALSNIDDEPTTVLQNADVALVLAKERGRDTVEMFDDELRTRARHRLETERDLRQAIELGELRVYFQPKIDLRSGHALGAEALLRWEHPTRGIVGPVEFIPIAEETGLINRIGRWVLDETLHQARTWLDRGHGDGAMTMSVNLSARELRAPGLVENVASTLARHRWDPAHLILELTESILVDDIAETVGRLQELKDLGIRIAIDDFGTGYSSLSYLDQLPVDIVKIDRAFVSQLQADGKGSAIVTAVLHLAAELDLVVLAEGVEEQHQLDGLRLLGCQWAQGYHFARPLPAAEMTALLDDWPVW